MVLRARGFAAIFVAALAATPSWCGVAAQTPDRPALTQDAQAPQPKAVVELFTSQGCSSCPQADALFVELAKDPAIVTLTFPVTYWDYLGWKDTLGQDGFTKRQKLYAKARGDGQVYTPQAVVNGGAHLVGSDKAGLEQAIGRRETSGLPVAVFLQQSASELAIRLVPREGDSDRKAGIWIVPTSRMVSVPIGRGENTGRTISYANVARGMVRIGDWDGKAATVTTSLDATRAGEADGYVVIVQAEQPNRNGAILGAARKP